MAGAGNIVPAVFFKARDVNNPRTLSDFEVCQAVAASVGHSHLLGCQRIGGLWRVYLKDKESRIKLTATKMNLRGQLIHIYEDNPFRAGIRDPDHQVKRITVKDLPLSKGNSELKLFLQDKQLKMTSEIQYSKARNPQTKELTEWLNGDRVVFVEDFTTPLPRTANIASSTVRIYHEGQQEGERETLCTKCFSKDHTRTKCTKPDTWCRLCQEEGHQAGEEGCDSVLDAPQDDIRTIFGYKDPLSNHFSCDIHVFGQTFQSAEQAYQHTKAINANKPDIAENILTAKHAAEVKKMARNIPFSPSWQRRKEEVMDQILDAKKEQVEDFRDALVSSDDAVLAGAAPGDFFWGTGLTEQQTKRTRRNKWPGANKLGRTLHKLRQKLKEHRSRTDQQRTSSLQNSTAGKKNKKETRGPNTRSNPQRDPSQREITMYQNHEERFDNPFPNG